MPTYDYECAKGHRFELFQRMSDEPLSECPECGAESRRVISGGSGFLFKGDGFYITDYRSEEYKKKASAESGPGAGDSGSSTSPAGGSAAEGAGDSASSTSGSGTSASGGAPSDGSSKSSPDTGSGS